jgi:Na+ dependent nucleoside transporter N-terminus
MTDALHGLIGLAVLLLIGIALSENRSAIQARIVLSALAAQIAIGALALFVPWGRIALSHAAAAVNHVLEYGNKGVEFLFGGLVTVKMHDLFGVPGTGRHRRQSDRAESHPQRICRLCRAFPLSPGSRCRRRIRSHGAGCEDDRNRVIRTVWLCELVVHRNSHGWVRCGGAAPATADCTLRAPSGCSRLAVEFDERDDSRFLAWIAGLSAGAKGSICPLISRLQAARGA